eukprot:GFUD01014880.1.p1 GENE.GFUD01014880.1~~GFUD01014880.1.p1  ORF type:complete len:961 (+),score=185.10 GFUD01014880.1:150-3032(+)
MGLLCGGGGSPPSPASHSHSLPHSQHSLPPALARLESSAVSRQDSASESTGEPRCKLFISEDKDKNIKGSKKMDPVMGLRQPPSPGHIHKQGPRLQQRWQNYIETEQNTVEGLLADSFKHLCQDLKENLSNNNPQQSEGYARLRSDSFSSGLSTSSRGSTATAITDLYSGSLPRSPCLTTMQRSAYSHGTLPRSPARKPGQQQQVQKDSYTNSGNHGQQNEGFQLSSPPTTSGVCWQSRPAMTLPNHELPQSPSRRLSFSSQHIPAGIAEVEKMYNAMKNLNTPLPNAPHLDGFKMPAPYSMHHHRSLDDMDQSDVASVMGDIPPPPPPVQSHAVLESGLGHQIPIAPRTPGTKRRIEGTWPKPPNMPLPPLPPKRTSSQLSDMMRPNNLNLSNESDNSIYSRPRPFLHRSSLMSTGSSDSGASSVPSDPELPLSPLSPSSELMFTWPNYSVSASSPTDHRSVSQVGEPDNASMFSGGNHSANTSMTSHSGVYVKMHPMSPVFAPDNPDSEYMNLLYSAVQRQGGTGSVENAMSPYLEMTANNLTNNVKNLRNAAIDSVSAIYAQIESSRGSSEELNLQAGGTRGGHLAQVDKQRKTPTGKSKQLTEFRELMLEVEKKRHFRVGLNLFNTNPDMGMDYLVKQNFIELSPLSVAKFLYKDQGLAKAKVGEYLGQLQSAFSMKVLSVFMEEFNFCGLRIDKALRQLLDYVKVPGDAQKIEKIMEVFGKRFNKCNPSFASKLKCQESVVTLAFAIMLLNTDLHTTNLKADKKMLEKEFMNSLKLADDGHDFDHKLLKSVYKGIKKQPFSSGIDHVAQTNLFQANLIGKPPQFAESHRRLVCLCRLAEVLDINTKKESESQNHPRDIWLFNDMMVLTKVAGKSNGKHIYNYRESFPLRGMEVTLFHTPVFKYGIQVTRKCDSVVLATLNADSEADRYKFVMDLQESIFEMDLMERAFREANLIK